LVQRGVCQIAQFRLDQFIKLIQVRMA
jgi:hypothetical protein